MSLINNHTFECSMGHQISQQDALFHLHTSDGQHYLSNQQVMHHLDATLLASKQACFFIVGGFGFDARRVVSSLGGRGDAQ